MYTYFFKFKKKFTSLSPSIICSKFYNTSFWIASINSEFFCIIKRQAIDPNLNIIDVFNRTKILNFLVYDKLWMLNKLPRIGFIKYPQAHSPVCGTCDKLINFLNEYHIQYCSFMPWNRLYNCITTFNIFGIPYLNLSVSRRGNHNF